MNSRSIVQYVAKTSRYLKLLHISKAFQKALLIGLVAAAVMLIVSRLFILPYYEIYAYGAGALFFIAWIGTSIYKLPKRQQAVQMLDGFTPHNQLLTVWQSAEDNALTEALVKKTEEIVPYSYQLFKKEPKKWILGKWLAASLLVAVMLVFLSIFPSTLQQQAKEVEEERELIEKIKEKVAETEKKATVKQVKKELEELGTNLKKTDTADQALQEIVKKQKELSLQSQKLDDEKKQETLKKELGGAAEQLADQAGKTQTALSNMGKPVPFPLQQTIANSNSAKASTSSSASSAESGTASENAASGTSGENAEGENQGDSEGEGQGQGQGEGQGEGQGQEQGQGQGQGGNGSGGQGQGKGGKGAGTGQGNRDLLTVPSRIGGTGEQAVDNGKLGEGQAANEQKGAVTMEKGTAKPYSDAVGDYSASYFSSADRMELPPDLQKVVEEYFSSIESEE